MGTVIVDVMPKQEILDPQGQAVAGALSRMGVEGFTEVRQGKRFTLEVEGEVTQDHLVAAEQAAANAGGASSTPFPDGVTPSRDSAPSSAKVVNTSTR